MTRLALFFSYLLFSVSLQADYTALKASPTQSKTAIEIIDRLSSDHFRKLDFNDQLSSNLLNNYVESLDPAKSYFTRDDIKYFSTWSGLLDDQLKRGSLDAGFAIYNLYAERAVNRWNSNIALLESGFVFDYKRDESLSLDTENIDWMATRQQLDDYWRKRIKDSLLRLILNDKDEDSARTLLVKRYKNLINRLQQRDAEDVFEVYMNALSTLYDPHTNYLSPRSKKNFEISLSLSLEGIGAVLQKEDEHTQVVRIVPGGAAEKNGRLKPEDKIIAVGQGEGELIDVIGWRLDEVVELIRGPKDTTVKLEVIPAISNESHVISIVRDKIKLEEQAAQSDVIEIPGPADTVHRFGVITIPAFYLDIEAYYKRDKNYKSTTRDVMRLIKQVAEQGVDGIILDLRGNGGGFLQEATTLTDLFIDQGPVVQVRFANDKISRHQRSRSKAYYSGPLLVLINRLSASASEIFAGAIQDYGRALIVGETSFGKGTVQARTLLEQGELKLTESKFYRVSGDSTQNRGVVPDIKLPSLFDHDEIGESSEDHALPWDRIHAVPHRRYYDFSSLLSTIRKNHAKRLESDPDLIYLTEESVLFEKLRGQTLLPLNIEVRKDQRSAEEHNRLALENKRRVRKSLPPYKDAEEWKKRAQELADKEMPISETDPILYEAGNIFADYFSLQSRIAKIDK